MAERNQIFKCEADGQIVEVLHGSKGEVSRRGSPIKPLKENSSNGAKEKHVPVIEKIAGGFKVTVGSVPHPMEERHYIELLGWASRSAKVKGWFIEAFINKATRPKGAKHSERSERLCRDEGLSASINYPLTTGDGLWTAQGAQASPAVAMGRRQLNVPIPIRSFPTIAWSGYHFPNKLVFHLW